MISQAPIRLALFFGGVSSEHEVSCVSAAAWLRALRQPPCAGRYAVSAVGITKEGPLAGYTGPADQVADGSWQADTAALTPCVLSPDRSHHGLLLLLRGRRAGGVAHRRGRAGAARQKRRGRHDPGPV